MKPALLAAVVLAAAFACPTHASAGELGTDCIFGHGFDDAADACPARSWVSGYYVGYERHLQPVASLDLTALTHLMVGRIRPLTNATLTTDFDIDSVHGPVWAQDAVDAAHAAGRKAILMVGGAGEIAGWRSAAAPANRPAFVTNLIATMDQFDADGLDLDWEPMESQDHADFMALVQALRAARPGIVLTLPLGWINTNIEWNPRPIGEPAFLATVAPLLDQINIMTYEMAAAYEGWHSWFASPLDGHAPSTPSSTASSIAYYLDSGVPAGRLGLGIGFYGNCLRGVAQPRVPVTPANWVASDGAMSYRNIVTDYLPAMTAHFDAEASAPWLGSGVPGGVGPQQCNFVSYENPQSIAEKGLFAHDLGLGGAIIWTISQGHFPGHPTPDPLLDAVADAFQP